MEALLGILIGLIFYHIYNSNYTSLPTIEQPIEAPKKPVVVIREEQKVEVKIKKEDALLLGMLAVGLIGVTILAKKHLEDREEEKLNHPKEGDIFNL